jgi:hypothetical protein
MYNLWVRALVGPDGVAFGGMQVSTAIGIVAVAVGTVGLIIVMLSGLRSRRRSGTPARIYQPPVTAHEPPEAPSAIASSTEVPTNALETPLQLTRQVMAGVTTAPLRDRTEWRVGGQTSSRPLPPQGDLADADTGPLRTVAVATRDDVAKSAHESAGLETATVDHPLESQRVPDSRLDALPTSPAQAELEYRRGLELLAIAHGAVQPLRDALAHFRRTQELWTREQAPEQWAKVQNDIGRVYQALPDGDRATNLRTAILYYQTALEVFDPVKHAMKWAWTQSALGAIYQALPNGSAIANARAAVAYHQRALDVFTRENAPLAWAWNQNNLGTALETMRGGEDGDRVAHLHDAVRCYQAALEIYTTSYPTFHEVVTRNLARVQRELHVLE